MSTWDNKKKLEKNIVERKRNNKRHTIGVGDATVVHDAHGPISTRVDGVREGTSIPWPIQAPCTYRLVKEEIEDIWESI